MRGKAIHPLNLPLSHPVTRRTNVTVTKCCPIGFALGKCGSVAFDLLFAAVSLAVSGGILVVVASWLVLWAVIPTTTSAANPIDLTKVALSVTAGVGGAVALVVAYRRQRDVEQGRFIERFVAAARQLGDKDVAVRIAGAYAMAGVAEEATTFQQRQQSIDVLCGYLRLPYFTALGANHRTVTTVSGTRTTDGWRPTRCTRPRDDEASTKVRPTSESRRSRHRRRSIP